MSHEPSTSGSSRRPVQRQAFERTRSAQRGAAAQSAALQVSRYDSQGGAHANGPGWPARAARRRPASMKSTGAAPLCLTARQTQLAGRPTMMLNPGTPMNAPSSLTRSTFRYNAVAAIQRSAS